MMRRSTAINFIISEAHCEGRSTVELQNFSVLDGVEPSTFPCGLALPTELRTPKDSTGLEPATSPFTMNFLYLFISSDHEEIVNTLYSLHMHMHKWTTCA